MGELFSKLGIDWKLLVAQIINFLVLLFILYKLAYKPILKILHERRQKIEKGLHDAKSAEERLKAIDKLKEDRMIEARQDAQAILEKTQQEAEQLRREKITDIQREIGDLVKKTKVKIERERKQMVEGAKTKLADVVVQASQKIIEKKMDEESDRRLIEETVKHLR